MSGCNCNDNYENIKRKLDEKNSKIKYCYIQGPKGAQGEPGKTGARGPQGPASISVGLTETVMPDSNASVENIGTAEDLILKFSIPKGNKGEKGDIGPQGEQGIKGEKGETGERGPAGPQGEQGPATIKVGKTETLESDKEAQVQNVGTTTDVILDFKIPKGEKGDTGDIGPRGLPGEIGRTEHIAIDETETLEPGEPAQVMDTFENWVHHLAFLIPKGEKGDTGDIGPIGPQGPPGTGFISSYGIRYSMTDTQLSVSQGTDTVIPLPEKGTALFTEYPDDNSIKIRETGVYLVSYLLCGAPNEECSITMSVRANGLLQPATNTTSEFQAQMINSISGSTIISLQSDDLVTLNAKASKTVNIKFNGSTNAMLSVIKIH